MKSCESLGAKQSNSSTTTTQLQFTVEGSFVVLDLLYVCFTKIIKKLKSSKRE